MHDCLIILKMTKLEYSKDDDIHVYKMASEKFLAYLMDDIKLFTHPNLLSLRRPHV